MKFRWACWAEYFEQLFTMDTLSRQLLTAGLQMLDGDSPIDEPAHSTDYVKEDVEKLRGGKPANICKTSAELLKARGEAMIRELHAV